MRPNKLGAYGFAVTLIIALVAGFGLGRVSGGQGAAGAAVSSPTAGDASGAAATATRTAELAEIGQLQTRIAQTPPAVVCTVPATNTPLPSPTPSPTATLVPPAVAGIPHSYAGDWTVNVLDASLFPKIDDVAPTGVFLRVSFTITNNAAAARSFPYNQLTVRDEKARHYIPATKGSLYLDERWYQEFPPSVPTTAFMIFDIAKDATGPFILESKTDPTFRVTVDVAKRG
jgi:hypothetical protein